MHPPFATVASLASVGIWATSHLDIVAKVDGFSQARKACTFGRIERDQSNENIYEVRIDRVAASLLRQNEFKPKRKLVHSVTSSLALQNCSALSAIVESAPLVIRARCAAVSGRLRSMKKRAVTSLVFMRSVAPLAPALSLSCATLAIFAHI